MSTVPLWIAFVAGIVSFLSPCVLPIIPGFLAYLAGASSSTSGQSNRKEIFLNSFFFVFGFSIVFAVLGVLLRGILGNVAYQVQTWLARTGGAIVVFFGLYLMGFFRIPFFEASHSFKPGIQSRSRHLTSLLFGFSFAAGWTPCVGPVLGGIFGLAAAQPNQALYLLFSYALGLGTPFLVVGLFAAQASSILNRYTFVTRYVTPIFGFILVALGVLVFTQNLPLIANLGFLNSFLLK